MVDVVCLDLTTVNMGFMDTLVDDKPNWLTKIFFNLPKLEILRLQPNSITGMINSKVISNLLESSSVTVKGSKQLKLFALRSLSIPGLDIQTRLIVPFISLFPNLEELDISECRCLAFSVMKETVFVLPFLRYLNISSCPNLVGNVMDLFMTPMLGLEAGCTDTGSRIQIISIGNPQLNKYFQPPPYMEECLSKK
ncbi:hypothetical protein DSO57_1035254 [Entomophthora muscae]|uniref:Uncharacterized protein n=1 Tax=Entomophthora muscae TaxID=34485 RepID=A0ACC2TLJ3_9FUNG|nr:hypothetical protein DSO57_1035254 [Entomophthora muscae]